MFHQEFKIHNVGHLSHLVGKPTICICENKDADQLRGNREADQRLCFRYTDSTLLYFLNPKFQASSLLLCFYSLVCVGPVRKPHCWFSHEAAQMFHQESKIHDVGHLYLVYVV